MYYFQEITVPANTTEASPQRTVLKVTAGIAREQWVMFPDGCYGLTHIQIRHHGWQVWPWDPRQSFHWNDYVFHIQDRYPFTAEPYEMVILTWNLDDVYDHTVTFAMVVDASPPPTELADLAQIMQELGMEGDE